MAASTADREVSSRTDGTIIPYTGSSGFLYYIGCMVMKDVTGAIIRPAVQGAGASNARFLGINRNRLDLSNPTGASQIILDVFKKGVFTLGVNGTGVSSDIGLRAYALDDQTVGNSAATPCLYVGEIVGLGSTTNQYRVMIDGAVNGPVISGLSGFSVQN